jgi:hypothetical protein
MKIPGTAFGLSFGLFKTCLCPVGRKFRGYTTASNHGLLYRALCVVLRPALGGQGDTVMGPGKQKILGSSMTAERRASKPTMRQEASQPAPAIRTTSKNSWACHTRDEPQHDLEN